MIWRRYWRQSVILVVISVIVITTLTFQGTDHHGMDARRREGSRLSDGDDVEIVHHAWTPPGDVVLEADPVPDATVTCGCRGISDDPLLRGVSSTCSDHATTRGPGQKVISFSLFGARHAHFLKGVRRNLDAMTELYPGYVMRVYHDLVGESFDELCNIFCVSDNLDLCNAHNLATYGMLWRFTPMTDPLMAEMHSRDLDSCLTLREATAVRDWQQNTNATFYVMRDHPMHAEQILGGMFGLRVRSQKTLTELRQAFSYMLSASMGRKQKGLDQRLLLAFVSPLAESDCVSFDSYLCAHYASCSHRPWPTRRLSPNLDRIDPEVGNFVGSSGQNVEIPCPSECRPREHQDWEWC